MRKSLINLLLTDREKYSNQFRTEAYSQCGEDLLVKYIFKIRGVQHPSYMDIGANHPFYLSNTAMFYSEGSRGVNIEANPQLIDPLRKYRPHDINLNIGISDEAGTLDFYIMQDNTLSTFSKSESEEMIAKGKALNRVEKVELTTVSDILKKYCNNVFPDFLSLDVEGLDYKILQSIDFEATFPKIICVESAEYSPVGIGKRRTELIDFLISKGYYEYANTNLNAVMVKKEFWFI